MCWEMNHDGQLGNGTTTDSPTPVAVSGLGSGITAVKAGRSNTCVLTQAGGVKCWGLNDAGQLGNGTTINSLLPVDVSGLSSGGTAISIGAPHTCALTTGGTVKCWGLNADGELGNGTTIDSTTPVDVRGLGSGVTAIAAGAQSCALIAGTVIKCWGLNSMVNVNIVGQIAEIPTAEPPVAANPAVTGAPTTIVPLQPTPTSSVLQAGDSVMLAALHMSDSSRGCGGESYCHILRTKDGGWTWANSDPYASRFD